MFELTSWDDAPEACFDLFEHLPNVKANGFFVYTAETASEHTPKGFSLWVAQEWVTNPDFALLGIWDDNQGLVYFKDNGTLKIKSLTYFYSMVLDPESWDKYEDYIFKHDLPWNEAPKCKRKISS